MNVGVLLTLGYACYRFGAWKSIDAKFTRNWCWPFVLLFDGSLPSCRWQQHLQDSSLGVSFANFCLFLQLLDKTNETLRFPSHHIVVSQFYDRVGLGFFNLKRVRNLKKKKNLPKMYIYLLFFISKKT